MFLIYIIPFGALNTPVKYTGPSVESPITSGETEAHRALVACPDAKWQSQDNPGFLLSLPRAAVLKRHSVLGICPSASTLPSAGSFVPKQTAAWK